MTMRNFSIYAEAIILLDVVIHAEDDQSDCFSPTFQHQRKRTDIVWKLEIISREFRSSHCCLFTSMRQLSYSI